MHLAKVLLPADALLPTKAPTLLPTKANTLLPAQVDALLPAEVVALLPTVANTLLPVGTQLPITQEQFTAEVDSASSRDWGLHPCIVTGSNLMCPD